MAVVAVVKYNGGADALAWRFPSEGLGTWTKLMVNESQEAVLFANGQALDIFTTGDYMLSPDNIPFLNEIMNLPPKVKSPLAADIWYINKGRTLEVKWGTPAPVELLDPKYKALIPLKALGQFSVQIGESTTFLNNLAGTLPAFDNDSLVKQLRTLHLNMLKESILSYIGEKDISILEISPHLGELSEHLKVKIMPVLDGLGVKMDAFRLNHIKLSEESPVVKQINEAVAKKAVTELVGSEFVKEQSAEPQQDTIAVSEPAQTVIVPLGVSVEADSGVFGDMHEQARSVAVSIVKTCPVCYNDLEPTDRFCRECKHDLIGADPQASGSGVAEPEQAKPETGHLQIAEPEIKKKCPGCRNDMEAKARFCPTCGYDTNDAAAASVIPKPAVANSAEPRTPEVKTVSARDEPIVRKCGNCGTHLRDSQKFCHKCGGKPQQTLK